MNYAENLTAVRRLLDLARSDTGQAVRVRRFLLSWWNAEAWGGFDPTDLWAVDRAIADDMLATLQLIAEIHSYPDSLGLGREFQALILIERPPAGMDRAAREKEAPR